MISVMIMGCVPSGYVNSLLLKMTIEMVDFPMKNGDCPQLCEITRDFVVHFSTDHRKNVVVSHQSAPIQINGLGVWLVFMSSYQQKRHLTNLTS